MANNHKFKWYIGRAQVEDTLKIKTLIALQVNHMLCELLFFSIFYYLQRYKQLQHFIYETL